jgi:hypothetical protein
MSAVARLLEDDEAARRIEAFSPSSVAHGGLDWTSEDARSDADLRLYLATPTRTGSSPRTADPIIAFPCRFPDPRGEAPRPTRGQGAGRGTRLARIA